MSLLKIPCIFIAMIGLQITTTAPNSPVMPEETLHWSTMEALVKHRCGPLAVKLICASAATGELLVIVATNARHLRISHFILSLLAPDGTGEEIRVSPLFILGTLSTAFGGFIRFRCYHELGRLFTFELSLRRDHKLVTTGPYSVVRHPGYSGVVLCVCGTITWHASSGSWVRECGPLGTTFGLGIAIIYLLLVSVITSVLLIRMLREDEALELAFGEEWLDWVEKVPHRLIPGVY